MSIMSIDPRTMAQLIKLQLIDYTGMTDSGSKSPQSGNGEFMELLQSLMSSASSNKPASSALTEPRRIPTLMPGAAGSHPAATAVDASGYEWLIQQAAASQGLEASLVSAVIDAESSFNARSISSAGAKGLMQLMDGTSRSLGVTDPFDPVQNVQAGTRFLSNLLPHIMPGQAGSTAWESAPMPN
jgi:soluble lytic murein transglycosylase-like protein